MSGGHFKTVFGLLGCLLACQLALSPAMASDPYKATVDAMKADLQARLEAQLAAEVSHSQQKIGTGTGQLGWRLVREKTKATVTDVGVIGHPGDRNNARGVEIYGSFVAPATKIDTEVYLGVANWWRKPVGSGFDNSPIEMRISGKVFGRPKYDRLSLVMAIISNKKGKNYIISDVLIGEKFRKLNPDYAKKLEEDDVDFMSTGRFVRNILADSSVPYNSWRIVIGGSERNWVNGGAVNMAYKIYWTFK